MNIARSATAPLKSWIKRALHRRGYELIAEPFGTRVVRMIDWLGIDTVIDGGANAGQFGQLLRSSGYRGRIFSVEPLSSAFQQLSEAAAGDPAWHVERGALSDAEGVVEINIAGNSVSSSVLPMLAAHEAAAPASTYVGVETAPSFTVDSLVARHGIDPARTLLKLDVQGYEATVLAGARESLGAFPATQLELSFVPLYDGSWLAQQVIDFLAGHGYELWMLDPATMNDPETGRLMQSDGVFVRA